MTKPDLRLMIYRKMMWKRHQIRTSANRDLHELRYLFFEVSRRCNIHCRYCGSSCTLEERMNELTTQEWLDIIDQLAEDFDPKRVMIARIFLRYLRGCTSAGSVMGWCATRRCSTKKQPGSSWNAVWTRYRCRAIRFPRSMIPFAAKG